MATNSADDFLGPEVKSADSFLDGGEPQKDLVQVGLEKLPGVLRPIAETAVGGAEVLTEMVTGGIGQIAGGLHGLGTLATGGGMEKALQNLQSTSEALTSSPVTDIGKRGSENLMSVFDKARTGTGNITDFGPASRTAGEFGFDVLTQVAPVGFGLRAARQAVNERRKAQEANKAREDAFKAIDDKAKTGEYQTGLDNLDNTMIKYPQDYDVKTPQYGLGKGIKPIAERQAAFEADLRAVYEEQAKAALEQVKQQSRPDVMYVDTEGAAMGQLPDPMFKQRAEAMQQQLRTEAGRTITPDPAEMFRDGMELQQRGRNPDVWDLGDRRVPQPDLQGNWTMADSPLAPKPDIPIDPLQRATAVDLLSDPRYHRDVTRLENVEAKIQKLLKEYDDPIVQRGLQMNESLGLNKAQRITNELERLTGQRIQAQARVMAIDEWAGEMARRRPVAVEKTSGWDGPQQSVRVSFWDRLSQGMDKAIERTFQGSRGPIGRQKGTISVDLLTVGVPSLIKTIGESQTLKKFVGTFKKATLASAIDSHLRNSNERLMWIEPDNFHKMANKRSPSFMDPKNKNAVWSPYSKYQSIEKGLAGSGLDDIPTLWIKNPFVSAGELILDVTGHEGRHRMDVAKKYGLEKMPVKLNMDADVVKAIKRAEENGMPIKMISEDESHIMNFPGFMKLDHREFGRKLPKSEEGAADVRMLQAIATVGLSEVVRGGLKAAARMRAGTNKQPMGSPKKDASAQGILDTATGEIRTKEEWKATQDLSKLQDIDGMVTEGVGNWVNGNFLHQFSNNPLVKFVFDKVNNNIRMGHLKAKLAKEGTVGHTADPDSPVARIQTLNRSEKALLDEISQRYSGRYELSAEEIRTLGGSQKVVDAYQTIIKTMDKVLEDINKTRANPIQRLPGYLPRLRRGDFKLDVIDKDGNKVWSDLFDTRFERAKVERGLKEKYGDEYKVESSMLDRDTRGNPYNTVSIPFEELMAAVKKSDPRREAIESVAREYRGKRGFGRHSIHRKHIEGKTYNMEESLRGYIDSAYTYAANLENKKFIRELMMDPDINAPKVKEWANVYSELTSGGFKPGALIEGLTKFGEDIWSHSRLGEVIPGTGGGTSGLSRAIRAANNWFMWKALFAYRPVFLAAQAMQVAQFMPQHLAHMKVQGFDGSISRATYEGNKSLINKAMGKADPEFVKFMEYQQARGNIDPSMVQAMEVFGKSQTAQWLTGHAPAKIIENMGRTEASAVAYHFLKDAGLKGKELFMEAENLVNRVMVDYSMQERPGVVAKTGMLGQLAGPLSTFATNFWTTTGLFLKDIMDNPTSAKNWAPMGIHVASTALFGGLTGMLGVKVADNVMEILRYFGVIGPKQKNVSEIIQTSGMPDWATFGPMSNWLDMNVSGSFATPEMSMISANTFPGVKLISDILESLLPIVRRADTKEDRQKALKQILPNSLSGAMDLFDVDIAPLSARRREIGEVIPDMNRGFGTYNLTESEQVARAFGTHDLATAKEMAGIRGIQAKEPDVGAKKQELIDHAVSVIVEGDSRRDLGELAQKAVELGMTPQQFMSNIKSAIRNRELTKAERMFGIAPNTLSRMLKQEELEEYR